MLLPHIPRLADALRARRVALLIAAPGAGKTTLVPPALSIDGRVVVLQPRRLAARALARRVAAQQGWTLGREVGWHVRDDRHASPDSRVVFVTEGILTALLQHDPLLSDITTVVLDEFHERSVHADLALSLARQAWLARNDLRLLVMSATLNPNILHPLFGDVPVVVVPGTPHPVDVRYRPDLPPPDAVVEALGASEGDVLCFLPGAREIDDTRTAVMGRGVDADIMVLHGGLSADVQDAVLRHDADRRRVVLATNIAETSLTVPGVRAVVDTGLHKVARYDAARGIDRLETERVSMDAADQRAGRAGRLGPGLVLRLWDTHDRLRPHREPEIRRVDLAPLALAVACWGDMAELTWLEPPDEGRLSQAMALLRRLELLDPRNRPTESGRSAMRLPLHPRLARLVLAGGGSRPVCLAAAALADLRTLRADGATTPCDLWSLVHDERRLAPHIRTLADGIARRVRGAARTASGGDVAFRRAVLSAWPDRVARRRAPGSPLLRLASGTGARLAAESGVRADWLVALEVRGTQGADALVPLATGIEKEWLQATNHEVRVLVDDTGRVRAVERVCYDSLTLHEQHADPDPSAAADALASAWLARPHSEADRQTLARIRFAGIDPGLDELARRAALGCERLDQIDLLAALEWADRQRLDAHAPDRLTLPSGRTTRLVYRDDGTVVASAKLQELFGLADTPRLGPQRHPVLFELLAPNGRPVQTTRDLRSFWTTTYADVRKELRGRYPKHPWPDDPWSAVPTHRTRGR